MTLAHSGTVRLALVAGPAKDRAAGIRLARQLLPLITGIGMWSYGVSQIQFSTIGTDGLLASAGLWFFAGLAVIVGGFALELAGIRNRSVLTLYLVALVVISQGTIPILTHVPEYAWVYKHIGVAESFRVNGRVTDVTDIYQQWPAFFSFVAAITSAAGTSALRLALWAPLAFELANCLLLIAIFRTISASRTLPYLAAFMFEALAAWVGQDYLSPQAFAFVLWLAIILVTLRWLTPAQFAHTKRRLRLLGDLRTYLSRGMADRPAPTTLQRRLAISSVTVMFAVIVAAHQLTPIIALSSIAALTAIGFVRPRWLLLALVIIAAGFILSRYHLISSEYGGLFSGGNVVSNASGEVPTWYSGGQALAAQAVRIVALVMWGWTLLLVGLSWRNPGRVIVPAILAFVPFCILLGQSYGGEAIYRVFLFSAPWCAYLIASSLINLRWSTLRNVLCGVVPALFLVASLIGLWGPAAVNAFVPTELNASEYLYHHAHPGSVFILADQDFPGLETASYESFDLQMLPADPLIGEDWMNAGNISEVNAWVEALSKTDRFLVVSQSMANYAAYYGYPNNFEHLTREIQTSPSWTTWYRNDDVTIYRFVD